MQSARFDRVTDSKKTSAHSSWEDVKGFGKICGASLIFMDMFTRCTSVRDARGCYDSVRWYYVWRNGKNWSQAFLVNYDRYEIELKIGPPVKLVQVFTRHVYKMTWGKGGSLLGSDDCVQEGCTAWSPVITYHHPWGRSTFQTHCIMRTLLKITVPVPCFIIKTAFWKIMFIFIALLMLSKVLVFLNLKSFPFWLPGAVPALWERGVIC